MMDRGTQFDPVTLEILWTRLNSLVDKAASGLVHTSFSTAVREGNDFACVLMDSRGDSLAHSSLSIPSFLGTLPITTKHCLNKFPRNSLAPGDVLITNDPWLATGHLNDVTMSAPIFFRGEVVAFAGVIVHVADIGGKLRSPESREIYEEGLQIPITKFLVKGDVNQSVSDFILQNVRVSDLVEGDLWSMITAIEIIAAGVQKILEEYQLDGLDALAGVIYDHSEDVIKRRIRAIPNGVYEDEIMMDGYDRELTIKGRITVADDSIVVDYGGTSLEVQRALNCVLNYTYTYTVFPLQCLLAPSLPSNQGCYRPLSVTAPEGTLLNPRYPAPVGGRALVGHYLQAFVFGALSPVMPHRVPADSGSPMWFYTLYGQTDEGETFATQIATNPGQGGGREHDGLTCVAFPSNIANTPVEVTEALVPIIYHKKEIITDCGGSGQYRGGASAEITFEVVGHNPITVSFLTERVKNAARGRNGGMDGRRGKLWINGEEVPVPKVQRILSRGDIVTIQAPGGGGYGPPPKRARELIRRDLLEGIISPESAVSEYGLEKERVSDLLKGDQTL